MRPILIQIGEIGIPSYGIMLVVSFLAAIFMARRLAKKYEISPTIIEDLAFYLMIGALVGGRLLYAAFHWEQYANDILGILRIWEGGMMFFGGFIGGFIAGMLYLNKAKISTLQIADIAAPAIALGHFFTRIGCFLNGCCFGTPSNLPWAVKFPEECVAGSSPIGNYTLHPTQLYASLFGLILFLFLYKKLSKPHHRGEIFAYYLMFYGAFRFGIDFIRYSENSANFLINQIIAIGLIICGVAIIIRAFRRM